MWHLPTTLCRGVFQPSGAGASLRLFAVGATGTVWAGPRRGGVPGTGRHGDRCVLTPGVGDSPGKLSGAGLRQTEASGSTTESPGSVAKGSSGPFSWRLCHCFSLLRGEEQEAVLRRHCVGAGSQARSPAARQRAAWIDVSPKSSQPTRLGLVTSPL